MIFNSYVNVYQRVGELDHPKVSFPLEMVFPHHLRIAAETRRSFGGWVVWCGWNFSYHSCLSTKNGKLDSNFCLNPLDILFLLLGWLLCWITPDYSHFFSMWLLPHRRVFCKKSIHGAMEKDQPHYIIFIYTVYIYIYHVSLYPMICPWYSHDTLMIFSWYSHDTLMICPWYSHIFIQFIPKPAPEFSSNPPPLPLRTSGNAPWTCAGAWHLRTLRTRRRCRWSRYRSTGALSGSTGRWGWWRGWIEPWFTLW